MDEDIMKLYHQGYEEGKRDSPDSSRMNDLFKVEFDGIASEWEAFKSGLIKIALGVGGLLVMYGIWVGTMQTTISAHEKHIEEISRSLNDVEKRQQASDIMMTEIKTRLISIEQSLLEIKQGLRR